VFKGAIRKDMAVHILVLIDALVALYVPTFVVKLLLLEKPIRLPV
jgi:hypothetical protein